MMDVALIKTILPHRYPMLLVDRVHELVPGRELRASKAITVNEPWYAGLGECASGAEHAYPPVLLVESWCQAAGVLVAEEARAPEADRIMLFGSMTNVCFRRPAVPGDLLEHRVRLTRVLTDTAFLEGETTIAGEPALSVGQVVVAMRPAALLRNPEAVA